MSRRCSSTSVSSAERGSSCRRSCRTGTFAGLRSSPALKDRAKDVRVTTRLVEGRADTYGALGVATALLFSLVLVGRLMVASAVLNASLYERRTRSLGGT